MSQAVSDPQVQAQPRPQSQGWQELAARIDHTLLKPEATKDQIVCLGEEAAYFRFAAVSVNPCWINLVLPLLRGTGVRLGATIGFPFGATHTTVKRFEAAETVRLGAEELDMVMNIGALKSGDRNAVQRDISEVAEIVHSAGAILKVILETPLLSLEQKILACELSLAAKADYVKTASGFFGGATVEDIALMRGVVGDRARVKASGGIRTAAAANAMLHAGADRIGTSAGVAIVRELGAPEFPQR